MEGNAITVKIGAETDQVEQGLRGIQASLGRLEQSSQQAGGGFNASFAKIAGATAVGELAVKAFTGIVDGAFAAARATVQGFSEALNLGGALSDLAAQSGETAGTLLLLQRAFDNTGIGAEAVGPTLAKLSDKIVAASEGSKEAAIAFGRMGISAAELQGKLPNEQLAIVASGISGIEDPAVRAATAIDLFGKSGAKLLPLLTNFSGEMTEARATVGSLADIMDRRANVFDAVADRFLVISQKVRDFAAGILDRALPAIDAITSALSRIDAAAIGQRLADAFIGGQEAMKGFQAAVDAISIGQVSLAFKAFWESVKLQSMQTADAIYKNLVAGFQTAVDFLRTIFSPGGMLMTYIVGAFNLVGTKAGAAIAESLANALPDDLIFGGLKSAMSDFATTAKQDAEMLWGAMVHDVGYLKDQLVSAGAALPDSFAENYAKVPPLFDGITAQQAKVAEIEAEVTAATAATTAEREKQAAQTEAEIAARQALKDQAAADAEAEKAAKAALIQLEIDRNNALAAGNTEVANRLGQEIQSQKNQEAIATLTAQYQKDIGLSADEAARLATNFVNSKNSVNSLNSSTGTFAGTLGDSGQKAQTILDVVKGIKETKMEQSATNFQTELKGVRDRLGDLSGFIDEDLSNKSLTDIVDELGIDAPALMDSKEKLALVKQRLDEIEGLDPAEVTPIVEADKFKSKMDAVVEALGGVKDYKDFDVTPSVDKGKLNRTVKTVKDKLDDLGKQSVDLNLDASKAIGKIRDELKKEIDLAIGTSEGGKILGELRTLVTSIKTAVEKIEPKLPQQALAY
jgi:hypothetical protein